MNLEEIDLVCLGFFTKKNDKAMTPNTILEKGFLCYEKNVSSECHTTYLQLLKINVFIKAQCIPSCAMDAVTHSIT